MSDFLSRTFGLTGRVAIVTGGSSGIGLAMATALGKAGARVVLIARDRVKLSNAAADMTTAGIDVDWISADLGDRPQLDDAAERAVAVFGEPDILLTSAGVNPRPPMAEVTDTQLSDCMRVNMEAPFRLGQRFGPLMAERGFGRIINVGSQQSFRAFGNSGVYGASKAAVVGLTRSQAEAWSPAGVCCNSVIPGFVHTPLTAEAFAMPGRPEALAARTLVQRNGVPGDFGGVAVFLASSASDFMTGQAVFVDGGLSAA